MLKYILVLTILISSAAYGQKRLDVNQIDWHKPFVSVNGSMLQCVGCQQDSPDQPMLYSNVVKSIKNQVVTSLSFQDLLTIDLSESEKAIIGAKSNSLPASPFIQFKNASQRMEAYYVYSFNPIVNVGGQLKKVVGFSLNVDYNMAPPVKKSSKAFVTNSVLATGEWYKIGVTSDGVYKLDYNFLANLGVDIDNVDPTSINVYGNGAGLLPESNASFRYDDLTKNAISFVGNEADGSFDASDYILFYGNGPHKIRQSGNELIHDYNYYCDSSFYYISIDPVDVAKRINSQAQSINVPNQTVTTFNDYKYHEKETFNFWESGQEWYGDTYSSVLNAYIYSFNFPNITTDSIKVVTKVANKSAISNTFTITTSGASGTVSLGSVAGLQYTYAKLGSSTLYYDNAPSLVTVNISYDDAGSLSAEGYLDEINVNVRRNLDMTGVGTSLIFQDINSMGAGNVADFQLIGANNVSDIWDVSAHHDVSSINYTDAGSTKSFVMDVDSLRKFVALTSTSGTNPVAHGRIPNQNLHGLGYADLIIVSPSLLLNEANDLASFHQDEGLTVHVVTPEQIYHEFSSGMRDVTSIRHFLRMFYERAGTDPTLIPKHLLLFGDGSYDNKGKINSFENGLPTYQSLSHVTKTGTFTSDDYFVVLDDNAAFAASDLLDMSVGRLPITTTAEAKNVVNKIRRYAEKSASFSITGASCTTDESSNFGDWKNKLIMISDDEDGGAYMTHTEEVADQIEVDYPWMNINKVHSDSYVQESTPGGERYYDVYDEIKDKVEEGVMAVNYIGHGGEVGWAEERFLDLNMINQWTNANKLPIFMTATCEFSRFDDPNRTSAGELLVLNPDGGAIGMFTTWRLVFAGPNLTMNKKFYDTVFKMDANGAPQTLGSIYVGTKNAYASTGASENGRKFGLLGDPALRLALPEYEIVTDEINDVSITSAIDTLHALSKIKIEGHIENLAGAIATSYNGVVYLTVFDKYQQFSTLANNATSGIKTFNEQNSTLYKGKATVVNGLFSFTFVAPKDINLQYGKGKLSFYADNGVIDAKGYSDSLTIGGTNPTAITDVVGPTIDLYMNDSNFVYGGLTDESPTLVAYISDSNGVNTTGNSIGHDLTATLDGNTANAIVLNDQYEADLNTYQKGSVAYKYDDLSEGVHTLELKAWDVYNNSNIVQTEFVVASSAEMALDHVLNYPNPFTTSTEFMLEHNQVCNSVDVQVQIFTVSGRLVKTINESLHTQGFRISGITWNGTDEFGDRLARGTYFYRVKVNTDNGAKAEKFERLVILK